MGLFDKFKKKDKTAAVLNQQIVEEIFLQLKLLKKTTH